MKWITVIGALASAITIFAFLTGKMSVAEIFRLEGSSNLRSTKKSDLAPHLSITKANHLVPFDFNDEVYLNHGSDKSEIYSGQGIIFAEFSPDRTFILIVTVSCKILVFDPNGDLLKEYQIRSRYAIGERASNVDFLSPRSFRLELSSDKRTPDQSFLYQVGSVQFSGTERCTVDIGLDDLLAVVSANSR